MFFLKRFSKKAQITLEYVAVFSIISAALMLGANQYIKPAVMKLMQRTGEMIERQADRLSRHYE